MLKQSLLTYTQRSNESLLTYQLDKNTIIILTIPTQGPKTLELFRKSYYKLWEDYKVPPQHRGIFSDLCRHYELHYEPHNHGQIDGICFVCLSRKLNRGPNAYLLEEILNATQVQKTNP